MLYIQVILSLTIIFAFNSGCNKNDKCILHSDCFNTHQCVKGKCISRSATAVDNNDSESSTDFPGTDLISDTNPADIDTDSEMKDVDSETEITLPDWGSDTEQTTDIVLPHDTEEDTEEDITLDGGKS